MASSFRKIIFLTGAGISAESGLETFRDAHGLWNKYNTDDVASLNGFINNPKLVHQFYNELRMQMAMAQPNDAHLALSYLQHFSSADIHIITQNIDTLHEKAFSKNIWHMHGQINQLTCLNCHAVIETWSNCFVYSRCPHCKKATLRPNIVFFGEKIFFESVIENLINTADLFVAVGTSGTIPPASLFARDARKNHCQTIALNLEKPENYCDFDQFIQGNLSQTLPSFVQTLLD